MKVYAVRQKSTGLFIPRLETGKRRGGSYLEPSNEREPRIFHNKKAAQAFLGNWLQGIFKRDTYMTMDGVEDDGTTTIPQTHRKKEDMEIVEFECVDSNVFQLTLQKRPVAFRVSNGYQHQPGWSLYTDEEAANNHAVQEGCEIQGLYVRDGT